MIDYLKMQGITALFTSLTGAGAGVETSEAMISSLMDAWLLTVAEVSDGRRRRWINVLKSRGMPHSDVVREFRFSDNGIDVLAEQGPASPVSGHGR